MWAGPRRCLKHPNEMDAAVAALVRESLQAQIRIERLHALDYPSQHVFWQTVRTAIVGWRLSPSAEVEHPHRQGLCKILCI